jgi:hypothetical protein
VTASRRGRPRVGPAINVRVPPEDLARVDSYAERRGIRRASAIRELIEMALEDSMTTVTVGVADITELHSASLTRGPGRGYGVLAVIDGELEVVSELRAEERGWPVVYDQPRLWEWLDGKDLTPAHAAIIAAEIQQEIQR